jgi:multimeric flavodoxin WrbA
MKLLAIVGSPRLAGNTDYLVDQALEVASGLGADTEKIILSLHEVNPCLGHDQCASLAACNQKDDAGPILDRMCAADGVILATPVYYYNVTAQMKTFIDRNYFLYEHGRKSRARAVGVIIVAGSLGIEDTLHTLRRFIDESFAVRKDRTFIVTGYANAVGEAKSNLPLVEKARKLGQQIVSSLGES